MSVCLSCGHDNPEGTRFCGSCGTSLAPTRTREVRKTVTVLFADVTGSTALGESHDPESVRRIMARYFDEMKAVLERHGGTVEKFIGDAVMAVFGIPTLHEDDARRALHAASQMSETLDLLNEELERDYGVTLEARIGVNTGEIVTGIAEPGERLATGDVVNVAARLQQAAAPGHILLGEQTFELARDAIEVEPVEPLSLKGKARPVAAYRLLRVIEGAPAFERRLDTPLVGRGDELARLRDAFDRVVSERVCRLVTVVGPPGIGKSRLAREVAEDLRENAIVLKGRCLPYGEGITYWPLREIFTAAEAEDDIEAALAAGAPEDIFWEVRKMLERRARGQPLVLVIEDIHWAEPTLLDLIEHLVEWTRDAQLLLLCLTRPELLDVRAAWGAGRPNAETLALATLADDEADELIHSLIGGSQLDPEARARIRDVSEGNPLFVEQLLAMVAEGGETDRVPSTIHALLAARLDALPEDERDVLERASVVGLEFEWEALGELADDRRRPAGAQLAALVRKELIRPHEVIEDTFRFRHMLIRDAAYERIPKELRSDLHERFADWLDGRGEQFDEIVGYHLEQAFRSVADLGPLGDRALVLAERAAERLAASGERANGRGDARAAANLLERAASLLPSDDRRRVALLPSLGRALMEASADEDDRAVTILSEAVERGRAAGERIVTADAMVELSYMRSLRAIISQDELVRELDNAIAVFEELGDDAGLARALGLGGWLRFVEGEAAAAIEELERAAAYAHRVRDWNTHAECLLDMLWAILHGPTPVVEALAKTEKIGSRGEGNRRLEIRVYTVRAQLEAMRGRIDTGRDLIAHAKGLVEELGPEMRSPTPPCEAFIERLAGDAAAAERVLRPWCERLERVGQLSYLSGGAPLLADALFAQGRNEDALRVTERWHPDRLTDPEDSQAHIEWRAVRAKILARAGRIEEAVHLAREATEMAAGTDYLNMRANAFADLAEVLSLAGKPEESAAAVQEATRLYEQKGNVAAAARLSSTSARVPPRA